MANNFIGPVIKLMRPGDWVKNVFVLLAPTFALPTLMKDSIDVESGDMATFLFSSLLAFVSFCLLSSGFYAINDVIDAEDDRKHPVKRNRPVAHSDIQPAAALTLGGILLSAAVMLGFLVNTNLVIVLILYGVSQALYNLFLKRVMLVDVVTIALGFAFRATAGAVAIDVQISVWLLLCVFFLCLYLGFIKRLCDLSSAEAHEGSSWQSPAGYMNRSELNWLLGISAVLAIMTYLMYSLSSHAWSIFGSRSIGFAILSPLIIIVIHRFHRRAEEGSSDSPLDALRTDRTVLASVILFAAGVLVTLYIPAVKDVLNQLFIAHGDSAGL